MPATPLPPLPIDALRGRLIAITGAGDGIGRAVALAAAAHGAELVLIGRTVSKLESVHAVIEATHPGAATIAPLDLERAVAGDFDQLAEAIQTRFGRLDGLVHAAAMLGALAPIEQFDVPLWWRVLHVNLTAAFALTQVLLPLLRAAPDSSLIWTTSRVGHEPRAYWGAYAVSKAGVENLALMMAAELEGSPVRVNLIDPGPVRTRMRRQAFPAEDTARIAAPESVTPTYLYLLSAAARAVRGQRLACQGEP